jgi:hypothetical protein
MTPFVKARPPSPLPDPEEEPEFYGEIHLRYPGSDTILPMHFGYLMKARGELALLLHTISSRLFATVETDGEEADERNTSSDEDENPSTAQIAKYISSLLKWQSKLPDCLKPEEIVYPGQLKLQ